MKTTTTKQQLLKVFAMCILFLGNSHLMAQNTLPDSAITQSVCIGEHPYEIVANPTSTYTWTIINMGTGLQPAVGEADTTHISDSYILVDFTITGVYKLSVYEQDSNSCQGATVDLTITVNAGSSSTDVKVACDTYTWGDGSTNGDGLTYTTSINTPTFTLLTVDGCDSVITLDLTINNSDASTDVQVACDTYTWGDGSTNGDGLTYTTSINTPTFTATTVNGCDSIITLDLTINNSSSSTDVQVACDTYTWGDGSTNGDGLTYTTSINTPTFTLLTVDGCDSVITLDLTINNSDASTDVQVACDTYTWGDGVTNGDGNVYTSSTNTPTFTATTVNGCDSVITLDLTITASPNPFAGATDTICEGLNYDLNGTNTGVLGTITWVDASGSSTGFIDPTVLNAEYEPTPADILAGFVILELQISGLAPCTTVSSFITIVINTLPEPGPIFHN